MGIFKRARKQVAGDTVESLKDWAEENIKVSRDVRDGEPALPGGRGPGAEDFDYTVSVTLDGTTTLVEITDDDYDKIVGSGIARRRKGDRRDNDLGVALAMARAFQNASDNYAEVAAEMLR